MMTKMNKNMEDRLEVLGLGDGFIQEVEAILDNEYIDPNGESVFTMGHGEKRYMVEVKVVGDEAELVDISPVTTLQAK